MQHAEYSRRCAPMTRRHFCFIAHIIAALPAGREEVAEAFAGQLAQTNPRFDHGRFLVACGVESRA